MTVRYVIRRWAAGNARAAEENRIVHICSSLSNSEAWMQQHGFRYNGTEYVHNDGIQHAMFFPVPEARVRLLEQAVGKHVLLTADVPLLDIQGILYYDPATFHYELSGQQHEQGMLVASFRLRFTVLDVVTIVEELGSYTIGLLQPARRSWFCAPGSPTA